MSQVVRDTNVYFLPAATAALDMPPAPSMWRRLRACFKGGVWRVRLAMALLRLARRRPRTPLFSDDDETLAVFTERRAEMIERRPSPLPARVIDFGAARARLRPLPGTH